jgi:nucleoside-diphosphate-sugar epimerase
MSKILVTGGAGMIGSHLVDRLLSEDNKVVVIDDFSMGKTINLPVNKKLTVVKEDILGNVENYFDGVDIVFHLAALTRPRESMVHPVETNRVNVEGTLKVLLHSIKNQVKKFVFVSSASVYGFQEEFPLDEGMKPNPASPYALTKMIGEELCRLYKNLSGMKINCVRPFNVYGSRQNPKGEYAAAIPSFINALKNEGQPFITGDGEQYRDFVYVEDVVDLLIAVSESDMNGEIFNAGSGETTSINVLYKTICGILGKEVKPRYVDSILEPNTLADTSKAERLLNWKQRDSLKEGLIKTIKEMV